MFGKKNKRNEIGRTENKQWIIFSFCLPGSVVRVFIAANAVKVLKHKHQCWMGVSYDS